MRSVEVVAVCSPVVLLALPMAGKGAGNSVRLQSTHHSHKMCACAPTLGAGPRCFTKHAYERYSTLLIVDFPCTLSVPLSVSLWRETSVQCSVIGTCSPLPRFDATGHAQSQSAQQDMCDMSTTVHMAEKVRD